MKVSFKAVLLAIVGLLLITAVFNYKLISYGIEQASGQLKVITGARPIAEVLADPGFPDSLKSALLLVNDIKQYAVDSLGLKASNNYTTVYNQHGKEILWVVTACKPYMFEPLVWSFPLIGSFTYKGFFNLERAITLGKKLKIQGYDVEMRSVSGWSTLGWFKDPILSNMLADGPGELANTVIHELTHGTIFIPDSMTFNENLATFIGNKGALAYLKHKFGVASKEYERFKVKKEDSRRLTNHIIQGARQLDSLYKQMEYLSDSLKERKKNTFINKIIINMDTISFENPTTYKGYFLNHPPNNAYFISFLNYRERQQEFDRLLIDSTHNQLKSFIDYWKNNYDN